MTTLFRSVSFGAMLFAFACCAQAQNVAVQADKDSGLLWRPENFLSNATNAAAVRGAIFPSFTGNATKTVRVNAAETAFEFSAAGSGDVAGPASAPDNALVRFDTTTGKLLQSSAARLSDAGVLTGVTLSDAPVTTDPDFAIVVIPDTQTLSNQATPTVLNAQFQWAADNKVAENIKAVVGVGDITENANATQFGRAQAAWDIAKAASLVVVPAIGNHDYETENLAGRTTTTYNSYFGPSYTTTGYGASNYPVGTNDNFYCSFTSGGTTYLVLAMECFPRAAAVSWAQGIIAANPSAYIIITTHAFCKNDGRRVRDADGYGPTAYGLPAGDYNGDEIYDALVKPYSNVRMVVSGHFIGGAKAARSADISATTGAVTHQLFTDYQEAAVSDHYMLILRFKPASGVIQGSYYSPTLAGTDPANPDFELPYNPVRVADAIATNTDAQIGRDLTVKGRVSLGLGELVLANHKFTLSGNYDATLTFTAPTAVTFPTTGTLATLVGTESLSNKTLVAPNIGAATGDSLSVTGNITTSGGVLAASGTGTHTLAGLTKISATSLEHLRLNERFSFIGGTNFHLTNNAYFDATNFRRTAAASAARLSVTAAGSLAYAYEATGSIGDVLPFASNVFSVDGATGNLVATGSVTAASVSVTGNIATSAGVLTASGTGTHSLAGFTTINAPLQEHMRLGGRFSHIGGTNYHITNNAYYNGTDFKRTVGSAGASRLSLTAAGALAFSTEATGSADDTLTFGTTAFSADAAGNVVALGTLTAGSGATQVTTAAGLVRDAAIESTIARDSEVAAVIDDTAYDATSWNGVTGRAPSMNAVRDKIEAIVAGGGLGTADIDTSAEIAAIVTDENGSGKLMFSAGTLDIATGKTLTASNTLTFTGTDTSSVAFGAGGTVLYSGGDIGAATATTPSANDNDTSVSTTAYVQTELTAYASDTVTLTNKTYDAAATGNVLKLKNYIYLTHPHLADGTGATIGTTATAIGYGHATFSNSADEAANYVEYYLQVPEDIDTSVALRARLKVLLGGADTGTQRYVVSSVGVADSAVPTASTLANAINIDYAGDASGASGDVETSAWTTLTSWAGALTAGQTWRIRLARDGNATEDASTVNSTELGLVIEYGVTQ